jgi:hypothetical protein
MMTEFLFIIYNRGAGRMAKIFGLSEAPLDEFLVQPIKLLGNGPELGN